MSVFRIQAMSGMVPRLDPRLLADNQSQNAVNVRLLDGNIVPLRGPKFVTRPQKATEPVTIYAMHSGVDTYWLGWDKDVDVVKGPVAGDTLQRTYYTGDGEPRMTTLADAILGGGNDYPKQFYVLGVAKPTVAPTVGHTGGAAANVTRSYVYTFVTPYGEESVPSPATTYSAPSDATSWDLSNMETAPPNTFTVTAGSWSGGIATLTVASTRQLRVNEYASVTGVTPSGYNAASTKITALTATQVSYALPADPGAWTSGGTITRLAQHNTTGMVKRVYRTISGEYFFVAEIPVAQTTYVDTLPDTTVSLQGALKTLLWEMPPADMHSLVEMQNGMMAGLSGNVLCFCEPFVPYAWPIAYQQAMPHQGVALSGSGQSVMVSTDGRPFVYSGNHPSSVSPWRPDVSFPNVAKRGTAGINGGCLYPSHHGLVVLGQGTAELATKDLYSQDEDWPELNPETFIAAYHKSRYYAAYTDSQGGGKILILDRTDVAQVIESNVAVTALYDDLYDGNLYFVQDGDILQWDSEGETRLLSEWWSKSFLLDRPENMGAAQIDPVFSISEEESAAILAAINAVIAANEAVIGKTPIVRTGTTTNTSAVVTGLSKTDDLVRWMTATGTGVPVGTKIKSIDTSTQVTLTQNATASGSTSLSFLGNVRILGSAMNASPLNLLQVNASLIENPPAGSYDLLQFTLYGDGEIRYTRQVTDAKAFVMPAGYKSSEYSVRLSGNVKVRSCQFGTDMRALRRA